VEISDHQNLFLNRIINTLRDSWANGTKKTYLQIWNKFEIWAKHKNISPLPPDRNYVIHFMLDLSTTAPSQVKSFVAILGVISKLNNWRSPYKDEVIVRISRSIERTRKKREKTAPFPLQSLIYHLDNPTSPRFDWLRDALVCSLCCRTTWRAETICALNLSSLSFKTIDKKKFAIFDVRKSKTNQSGESFVYFIDPAERYCIVKMLQEYLDIAFPKGWSNCNGPIFLSDERTRMDTRFVSNIVKKMTDKAGFDKKYSSRSLRVAAVAWMLQSGFSIENIKSFGWSESSTAINCYIRNTSEAMKNASSKMFKVAENSQN
jgi:site-specific recombinase XerD